MLFQRLFKALAISAHLCYGGGAAAAMCAGAMAGQTHQEFATFVQTHTPQDVAIRQQKQALRGLALMQGQLLPARKQVFRRHAAALGQGTALSAMVRSGNAVGFIRAAQDSAAPEILTALSDIYWLSGCPALARQTALKLMQTTPENLDAAHIIRLMGAMSPAQARTVLQERPKAGIVPLFALRVSAGQRSVLGDLDAVYDVQSANGDYRPGVTYLRALAHHLWSDPSVAGPAANDFSKSLMFSRLMTGDVQYRHRAELAWVQSVFDHCDDRTMGAVPAMLQSPLVNRGRSRDYLLAAHLLCAGIKG